MLSEAPFRVAEGFFKVCMGTRRSGPLAEGHLSGKLADVLVHNGDLLFKQGVLSSCLQHHKDKNLKGHILNRNMVPEAILTLSFKSQ